MNCKLALIFLVVLVAALKSSQGKSIHDIKNDIEDVKKTAIAAKIGIGKIVAAKLKLAALKKLAAVKFIAKAPFVLGKKAVLLKIGAIKSLGALKAAKAKEVLDFASKKTAPAVAAVAKIPAAVAKIPAAVAKIPAAVAGISAAAGAALKPKPAAHSQVTHHTEVVDIYTYPGAGQQYQGPQHQIPANTQYHKSGLDAPRTYSYDYSLVPENVSGSQYYPVSDIIQPHNSYGVPAN